MLDPTSRHFNMMVPTIRNSLVVFLFTVDTDYGANISGCLIELWPSLMTYTKPFALQITIFLPWRLTRHCGSSKDPCARMLPSNFHNSERNECVPLSLNAHSHPSSLNSWLVAVSAICRCLQNITWGTTISCLPRWWCLTVHCGNLKLWLPNEWSRGCYPELDPSTKHNLVYGRDGVTTHKKAQKTRFLHGV